MGIHLKPHASAGKLASRWLTQSGDLSKAEQFFLDKWMTKTSIELRNTIGRECTLLHDIGVFDTLPDMTIIPHIETIAEVGARKFQVWVRDVRDALPDVVRSGFKTLAGLIRTKREIDPFEEVENPNFSSGFNCQSGIRTRDGLQWVEPLFYSATLTLGTPDLKHPFYSTFPSMEEAVMWTFHHEAAHAAMFARQLVRPIAVAANPLASGMDNAELQRNAAWNDKAWVNLLCIVAPAGHQDIADVQTFQTRWQEYYADVGATLLHARSGYSTAYLGPLCNQRREGDAIHQTSPVLEGLALVLDFHPIVLKKTIEAEDLHAAIGQVIAPQLGRDILELTGSSAEYASLFEQALPDLPGESHLTAQAYTKMHAALGEQYPKLALFFAKLKDGPDAATVGKAFEGQFAPTMSQQAADQMAMT